MNSTLELLGTIVQPTNRMLMMLLAKGYANGKLDGVCGNITWEAVMALMTDCGVNADGVVGPGTRVFLR